METETMNNRVVVGIFSTTSTWTLIRVMLTDLILGIGLAFAGLIGAAMCVPQCERVLEWLLIW